ncbi:flavodoxin [Fusibacter sp. Q10-2]|uniref:Flavodoxin n=2 Tax=Fusibacter ferrireducens TaxID=2785058 RepID=A0ABR9ZZB0_9FIRM|nr:flavodoxin [Fusibacter ferrireducens]
MNQSDQQSSDASALPKCLIVVYSYHHNNTAKIAQALSEVLMAQIKTPDQIVQEELADYDLIGFGAGIAGGKHYRPLLDLIDGFEPIIAASQDSQQKCFIFSTSAIISAEKIFNDHTALRDKLVSKGFSVIDEFSCRGLNTNSFLKFFGGMGRGRPNAEDLDNARKFAHTVLEKI